MAVAIVCDYGRAIHGADVSAALGVYPKCHLAAVERWLLDEGDGASAGLLYERRLVGGIAEEVAHEDHLVTFHLQFLHKGL